MPPMTWVFDATNNFGYFNTSEYKIVEETPNQARALSAAELPKLGQACKGISALPDLGQREEQ